MLAAMLRYAALRFEKRGRAGGRAHENRAEQSGAEEGQQSGSRTAQCSEGAEGGSGLVRGGSPSSSLMLSSTPSLHREQSDKAQAGGPRALPPCPTTLALAPPHQGPAPCWVRPPPSDPRLFKQPSSKVRSLVAHWIPPPPPAPSPPPKCIRTPTRRASCARTAHLKHRFIGYWCSPPYSRVDDLAVGAHARVLHPTAARAGSTDRTHQVAQVRRTATAGHQSRCGGSCRHVAGTRGRVERAGGQFGSKGGGADAQSCKP